MPKKTKTKPGTDIVSIATSTTTKQDSAPKPDWPPLRPLPNADQGLVPLDDYVEGIVSTPLLTSKTCATYRSFLASLPLTTTPTPIQKDHALRVNDRYQVDDPAFAAQLWSTTGLDYLVQKGTLDYLQLSPEARLKLWDGEVLGLNSNIRIYRYREGQFFDCHYDDSNDVMISETEVPDGAMVKGKTTWTLLIYLSDASTGCEGGETVFYPEHAEKKGKLLTPIVADLQAGMALLHRHGRECMLHEGKVVTKGEKWVIRSDLVVRAKAAKTKK